MIVLYRGARGRGKTLSMVKDSVIYFANNWKIYSNFKMPHSTYLSNEEILDIGDDSSYEDCVIIIDEMNIFFDGRRSMSGKNVDFSHFVQQIRKRGIIILCATQFTATLDNRLRYNADVIAQPTYFKDIKMCKVEYKDKTIIEDSIDGNIGMMYNMLNIINGQTYVFYAPPFFRLYNTREYHKKIKSEV